MCILGAGCLMYWSKAVRSVPGATSEARRERTTVYQSEQAVIGLSPMLKFYISDFQLFIISYVYNLHTFCMQCFCNLLDISIL